MGHMEPPISPRALEILTLIAEGYTQPQVQRHLFISKSTVKTHLGHAFERLGARNATHAVAMAVAAGLIPVPAPVPDPLDSVLPRRSA